jgi:hypothetical protein
MHNDGPLNNNKDAAMLKYKIPKFRKTHKFFKKLEEQDTRRILEKFGQEGVSALAAATPKDSGETASKWNYKITGTKDRYKLIWTNSEMAGRAPLVLMIQYGHATKSGGWYSGQDFVNPAMKPILEKMGKALLKEVLE